MKVALYARVSTTRQADKDLSIPDQIKRMQAYCKQHKHEVVQVFREEGASATSDRRPQFQSMMDDIQCGRLDVHAILVLTTSRFFRNAVEAGLWRKRLSKLGVRVIAITQEIGDPTSPTSDLIETIFAAIDEHESQMIGYHTARGMLENANRGYFNGAKPPYGYNVERVADGNGNSKGVLRIDEEEAKVIRRIFSLSINEGLGAVEIAKIFNREGLWRRGKRWNRTQVHRVMENPICAGDYYYNRYDSRRKVERPKTEWVHIPVEPIIERKTFDMAAEQRKVRRPSKKGGRSHSSDLLLSGLFKCGKCGSSMVYSSGKGGRYRYYACTKSIKQSVEACSGHRVPVADFEAAVLQQVVDRAFTPETVRSILGEVQRALLERQKPIRNIQRQIEDIEAKLERYFEAFEAGKLDPDDVTERTKKLRAEKRVLENDLRRRSAAPVLSPEIMNDANIALAQKQLREVFLNANRRIIKRYLNLLIEKVIIHGDEVTLIWSTPGILATLEAPPDKKRTPDESGGSSFMLQMAARRGFEPL